MLPRETTQVSESTPAQTHFFDIPEEVLCVLPSDPFVQLDVARKITSIALSTRISKLEFDCSHLRSKLNEKDQIISDLQARVHSLDASLAEIADRVSLADQEKESLLKENASLSKTINKLNRDVSKLESFRKTLKQSLEEEEDSSIGSSQAFTKKIPQQESLSSASFTGGEEAISAPSKSSSMRSQFLEAGNSFTEDSETDASRPHISQGLPLASQTSTPRLTPSGSPPSLSASVSPTRISKPESPRRHSISFSTTRGIFDDRSSISSSVPPGHYSSITSSAGISQTGQTRVDGKEFFRQVRTRLSYEQFSAFLANVKELNSHKQTREETLRKADEIFGPDNKDLYNIFEGLITRNIH
ncbi:uncharacterized protein At4g15545-like isoform X2 [Macadamia integrifolia]|uniref:uncharacterized protein At4g15545-like isoform X2 n=1 Tax=Macadamia integrifolia TaxID=60698 RepID=UPI001C4F6148|nr:uncharacterized protein At4g15545-like isoform X2 [Macadamia integrifolia]